jgi:DNA-directed RNA polymerase subunit M/transcription elongation factor TFIIS
MKKVNLYQFFCDNCNYKRTSTGSDIKDLIQLKLTDIPRGSPVVDKTINEKKIMSPIARTKIFKCPKCGHAIKPFKLKEELTDERKTNWIDGSETGFTGQEIS